MQLGTEVAETAIDKKKSLALAACYRIALERARIVREQQEQQAATSEQSDIESDTALNVYADECSTIDAHVLAAEL
jgi:hypothetical protein